MNLESQFTTWFVVLCIISFILNALFFYFGGKRAESIFNGIKQKKILFREKGASGYSKKSFITRLGGAGRALDIVVTEKELWIKGIYSPFTFIGKFYDLTHNIRLDKIMDTAQNGKNVEIQFEDSQGEIHRVVLILKGANVFYQTIKG